MLTWKRKLDIKTASLKMHLESLPALAVFKQSQGTAWVRDAATSKDFSKTDLGRHDRQQEIEKLSAGSFCKSLIYSKIMYCSHF